MVTAATKIEKQAQTHSSWMNAIGICLGICLLASLLIAANWNLVHDAALMDYIAFLIRGGFAPYRDIVDMNMPGAYLMSLAQTGILGAGIIGLLSWVSVEIAAVIGASIYIAGIGRRRAGFAAGCLTSIIHLSHGPWNLGQRDWDVAVFLLASCAFLLVYSRNKQSWLIAISLFFGGLACTIKPQAILFPLIGLSYLCAINGTNKKRAAIAASLGVIVPALCVLIFLAKYEAFAAFFSTTRHLAAYYASLDHPGIFNLAWGYVGTAEKILLMICIAAIPLYARLRLWRDPEINLIGIGALFGVASYLLQNKGWPYHRMPGWVFAVMWLTLVVDAGLRDKKPNMARDLSIALIFSSVILLLAQAKSRYPMETITHMQNDLMQLGAKTGEVQCLDMTGAGCVNVLYRLHLKQATGFIYDFYLFPQRPTPLTATLQHRFLSQVSAHPPRVIILSSHIWPPDRFGYDEVARWPAFQSFLNTHYRITRAYEPDARDQRTIAGYRIYLLNP